MEELQCLAEWRDSSYHYLVGKLNYQLAASNEDRYRCFIFERAKGHSLRIAESGDATCSGLSSPTEGARTLTFQKSMQKNKIQKIFYFIAKRSSCGKCVSFLCCNSS